MVSFVKYFTSIRTEIPAHLSLWRFFEDTALSGEKVRLILSNDPLASVGLILCYHLTKY